MKLTRQLTTITASVVSVILVMTPSAVAALGATVTSDPTAANQQEMKIIQQNGDEEITRRLNQLKKLSDLILASKHISATDQTTLTTEVTNEITGLTALKTKLDAETTLSGAITDAKSIVSDYRVYALVTPKVWLVKTADDQQTIEDKLNTLSSKLQTRLNAAKTAGNDITSLQTTLNDMVTQTNAAEAISSTVETKVLPLQPTDYNSDHTILSGDYTQLNTAQTDNQAAYNDAKTIVAGIKNM